jgi:hypothetical protein
MEPMTFPEITIGIAVAMIPFLAIAALLSFSGRLRQRERVRVARQIAVTDAMHRELGASVAPNVGRDWLGSWTVSVKVPFEQQRTVAAVARIAYDFFAKCYPLDVPRLRIQLTPREGKPRRQAALSSRTSLGPGDVTRAA